MTQPLPESEPHTAPRWHRRKESRPAEILEAAWTEFVERGFAAARLEDIARRAGVTKGTVYLYFENKESLFKAMASHNALPSVEAAEELVRSHQGSARELVSDLLRMRWERLYQSQSSGLAKVMISEAGNFPELARWFHEEIVRRTNAPLARALELGMERGEFRRFDVNEMLHIAVAPILMASLWKHSFQPSVALPFNPSEYLEHWIETFLRGLDPRPLGGMS